MCTPPSPPKKCLFAAITFLFLGSLSNDGGDVNKNGKKAIGLDWQNNNFSRAARFFSISLPSLFSTTTTWMNVSKFHSDVPKLLPNIPTFLRYLRVLWFILTYFYLLFWLKNFTENIEAIWASSFKIRTKILFNMSFLQYVCEIHISTLCCDFVHELSSVWRLCIFSKVFKGVYWC